jgi:hypothetical protein
MTIDIRKQEKLTYGEALQHLHRLLNTETYNKIATAIREEIQAKEYDAVSRQLAQQEYADTYFN